MIVQNCIIITLVLVSGVHCVCLFECLIMVFVSEWTLYLCCKKHVVLSPSLFFFLKKATCFWCKFDLSLYSNFASRFDPGISITIASKYPTWTNWLLQFNEKLYFHLISRFAWKCRILTCSLILCSWWLLQVPHPLYRPAQNRLIPCADSLCTALHSGLGSNKKCPSPKQCDYQIKYTDSASSQGVLITDNFSLPLSKSSNIRPSLTFGYNTWIKYFLIMLPDSVVDMVAFVCTGVGMISKWGKMVRCKQWQTACLGLGGDQLAFFHSSSNKGSPRMSLAIASARTEGGSSSLGMISCLLHA
jgi:hypothetical protein